MRVGGSIRVPGDKSISHRALMFGALARGRSRVTGILESADVHSTAGVLRTLGVPVPSLTPDFSIDGVGLRGLLPPHADLDCGNSGTTTRLMAGIVAGSNLTARFIGDSSLSRRPMRRIAKPLEAMGASVDLPPHGGLPMTIRGGGLASIDWKSEVASGQIKSAVLLAALVGGVSASIDEPERSRDHTERMLSARGARITVDGTRVWIDATTQIDAIDVDIPGDPSSATFLAGLAALSSGGEVRLEHVCVNETRAGAFAVLKRMGASVRYESERSVGGEPVADIIVSPATLRGTDIGGAEIPTLIDELPLLACIATRAEGETRITGAAELRVKESDRITAVVSSLRAIGADADELPDGMVIRGSDRPLAGRAATYADHRLAMAFGVLAAIPGNAIEIDDRACVNVSYPAFWTHVDRARVA